MTRPIIFTHKDVGIYADSTFGHARVREVLADLMNDIGTPEALQLEKELHGYPSDDFQEEDDAIGALNDVTDDSLLWMLNEEGDLILTGQDDSDFAP